MYLIAKGNNSVLSTKCLQLKRWFNFKISIIINNNKTVPRNWKNIFKSGNVNKTKEKHKCRITVTCNKKKFSLLQITPEDKLGITHKNIECVHENINIVLSKF